MSFGPLYSGIIKPREKVMLFFCMLLLNKIKVMTENPMKPRENVDYLKNFQEKLSLQSHCIFLCRWLICFPNSWFLWLAFVLMSKSPLLWICMYSDPYG